MTRMQIIEEQSRYWAKEAERLTKAAIAATKQGAVWYERGNDLIYNAINCDQRFKWRLNWADGVHESIMGDHVLVFMQEKPGRCHWLIHLKDNTMIAHNVNPSSNLVDCIAELIAYYDQFIEKKAAVNG